MKASIVIRTYNEEKHIEKLIKEIYNQDFPKKAFEIIVVDSGSTDDTLNIVSKYPIKLVEISPKNFSFGYSLNQGIREANGEYILMISAHCYPMKQDWIKKMINPLEKNEKVGLVYGKQRGHNTTKYSEKHIFLKLYPDKDKGIQKTPFCNNANCSIRKQLWQEYKYDETLTGLEDLDWAQHILKKGYFLYYQPEAGVYHIHDENYQQIFNRYKREAIALKRIFPDTTFGFWDFLTMFLSNCITDLYVALKEKKFLKEFFPIIFFRFSQFWGTYRGYKYKRSVSVKLKKKFYYPRKVRIGDNEEEDYVSPVRIIKGIKDFFPWIS